MGLRFDPIGGGQFKQAIKQIIEAESQPVKALEARKAREEQRLKLFQEFKGKFTGFDKALEDISSFKKLRELKVDLGDGQNVISATVDKEVAVPGNYQMEVKELAERTSVMSNGFADPDAKNLGIGFITMNKKNGDQAEIYVDEDHASLRGIADAINSERDLPVRAAVVKDASDDENPWKLIVSAKGDGKDNHLEIPDFYFLDGDKDFYIDGTQDAKNAVIKMNGFEIEADGNDIKDFLPGVNLHLKQAKPGQPFTMQITEDTQKIAGKVKNMVDQVNGVLEFIVKQNQVDDKSDTRTTFTGDTGLQTIEFRLRNMMHEGLPVGDPESENFHRVFMSDLGVEFDKTGKLNFKEDKFNKMIEKDYNSVSEALAGPFGFAFQMRQVLSGYTQPGGMLTLREQSLRGRIKQIDNEIDQKSRRIEQRQQSLTEQFSRLEASLSNLQRQQQYLSATLPGGGGGGNLVQQLLGG